jgi:hypothetical protein
MFGLSLSNSKEQTTNGEGHEIGGKRIARLVGGEENSWELGADCSSDRLAKLTTGGVCILHVVPRDEHKVSRKKSNPHQDFNFNSYGIS